MTKPRVLFVCGSINQTSQMHAISRQLPECEHAFTPYYGGAHVHLAREIGLVEWNIAGHKLSRRCLAYLVRHRLPVDMYGRSGRFDLAVTCSDIVRQPNLRERKIVLVQEGILDPDGFAARLVDRIPFLPKWFAGTARTGSVGPYDRYCVASHGYRDDFVARGLDEHRIVVTGIPNFDDCRRFLDLPYPRRGYVLVCTSDTRETFKLLDSRERFVRRALRIARGRPIVWKLHPNENPERGAREIRRIVPDAEVVWDGPTDAMIAHCDALIVEYSSTAFVGIALGKEVHSHWPLEELRRLLPLQHGRAAKNIANVCRDVLGLPRFPLPDAADDEVICA